MIVIHLTVTGCWWPGIAGIARRHASSRAPAGNEIAAAVAELREVAGDRPDLLAEEAGIGLGFCEGGLAEPRAKAAAQLLIAAGAEESLIPGWIDKGQAPGRGQAQASSQQPGPWCSAAPVSASRRPSL